MPSTGNNCLLHSISYNGDPRGSDKSDAYMRELREAIAATAIAYRDYDFNGKTLEGWVWVTAGMDLDSWAADFVASDTMSDQIVLRIWPFFRGEAVWVWQPSRAGGYEHHGVYRFGAPTGKQARHVLYRPAQLHYNALQVIRPAALERPVVSITSTARPRWVQQRSHRAAEQQPPPLTLANYNEARALRPACFAKLQPSIFLETSHSSLPLLRVQDTSAAKSTVVEKTASVEKTAVMASVPHRRWSNMCSSASLPTLNDRSSGGTCLSPDLTYGTPQKM